MNYELTKKLKDAGFKQEGNGIYDTLFSKINASLGVTRENVYYPTLSELIEACGDELWSMTKHGDAWQTNFVDGIGGETAGHTLEAAVAHLWLKLNKK
jgi:hypothetical protein